MELAPPGFHRDDRSGGPEILDPARDVGIAGGARRLAIALVVHAPDIVAEPRIDVHHRVLALAGNRKVVARQRCVGRSMHQEQHRPRGLAGGGRADPLAVDLERHIAFLGGVFGGPEFTSGLGGGGQSLSLGSGRRLGLGSCRRLGLSGGARQKAGGEASAGRLDHIAARNRKIKSHRFLPFKLAAIWSGGIWVGGMLADREGGGQRGRSLRPKAVFVPKIALKQQGLEIKTAGGSKKHTVYS